MDFLSQKKIKSDYVVVLDIMDNEKYQVVENQGAILFNSDDLFEGRLIPYKGKYYFTDNFCYHPKPTSGFILSKVKSLRASEKEALAKEKHLQKAILSPQKDLKKTAEKIKKNKRKACWHNQGKEDPVPERRNRKTGKSKNTIGNPNLGYCKSTDPITNESHRRRAPGK